MGAITIAIIALVVAAVVGFAAFLGFYHIQQRRRGVTNSSFFPTSLSSIFNSSSERETGTRFAALDVDEAWDSHVDEEMGYDSLKMQSHSGVGGSKEGLSHEELDDRYENLMEGGESSNPFGTGSSRTDGGSRKSAFRESM